MLKKKTRFLAVTCDRLETSKIPTVNFWYMKLLFAGNNSRRFLGEKFPVETIYRKFTAFCCFTNKFPLFEDLRLKQPLLAYSDSCTCTETLVCCNANHPHTPQHVRKLPSATTACFPNNRKLGTGNTRSSRLTAPNGNICWNLSRLNFPEIPGAVRWSRAQIVFLMLSVTPGIPTVTRAV